VADNLVLKINAQILSTVVLQGFKFRVTAYDLVEDFRQIDEVAIDICFTLEQTGDVFYELCIV